MGIGRVHPELGEAYMRLCIFSEVVEDRLLYGSAESWRDGGLVLEKKMQNFTQTTVISIQNRQSGCMNVMLFALLNT